MNLPKASQGIKGTRTFPQGPSLHHRQCHGTFTETGEGIPCPAPSARLWLEVSVSQQEHCLHLMQDSGPLPCRDLAPKVRPVGSHPTPTQSMVRSEAVPSLSAPLGNQLQRRTTEWGQQALSH